MNIATRILLALLAAAWAVVPALAANAPAPAAMEHHAKNWTAPGYRIYAQALADEIMKAHPELLSITFHGVPPGTQDAYTMFAGSFPERIGNSDDPDDVDVQKLGITIVDPRWHRTHDTVKKFVMMMPLRDKAGGNVGLLVAAYKRDPAKTEKDYFLAGTALRDSLQKKIPNYDALFAKAK